MIKKNNNNYFNIINIINLKQSFDQNYLVNFKYWTKNSYFKWNFYILFYLTLTNNIFKNSVNLIKNNFKNIDSYHKTLNFKGNLI